MAPHGLDSTRGSLDEPPVHVLKKNVEKQVFLLDDFHALNLNQMHMRFWTVIL